MLNSLSSAVGPPYLVLIYHKYNTGTIGTLYTFHLSWIVIFVWTLFSGLPVRMVNLAFKMIFVWPLNIYLFTCNEENEDVTRITRY